MKKFIAVIALLSILMSVAALPAFAADIPETRPTIVEEEILPGDPDADINAQDLVWKYRVYNGVLQKRRWNNTTESWYDPYWINA